MDPTPPSCSWEPDFRSLYDHELTSDVIIHIVQEAARESQPEDDGESSQAQRSRPTKRQATCRTPDASIHGHKSVLWAHSDVFRAKVCVLSSGLLALADDRLLDV